MTRIPISQAELLFEDVIFHRGRDYAAAGRVVELAGTGPGEYRARVEGAEMYHVRVVLDGDTADPTVSELSCTCPYDYHPHCKHQAAVLITLRSRLGVDPSASSNAGSPGDVPFDGLTKKLEKTLSRLSREELVKIILERAEDDRLFGLNIVTVYNDDRTGTFPLELREEIALSLDQFRDRWGTIDYRAAFHAVKVFYRVLEGVEQLITDDEWDQAFCTAVVVLEEAMTVLDDVDDGGGNFRGCVEEALTVIKTIAAETDDADIRRQVVEYASQSEDKRLFGGMADWTALLWEAAAATAHTPQEYRRVIAALQEARSSLPSVGGWDHDYLQEKYLLLTLHLMERFGDEADAQTLRWSTRHIGAVRVQLMERERDAGNYVTVADLTEEGILTDSRYPGLVTRWRRWALEAYQALQDVPRARTIAEALVCGGDTEYLETYKGLFSSDEWPAARDELIRSVGGESARRRRNDTLAAIYITDALWDCLMDYVEDAPATVTQHAAHLYPHFPDRVRAVWSAVLHEKARRAGNRPAYHRLAEGLANFASVAGDAHAGAVADEILVLFPKRPALADELSRIFD